MNELFARAAALDPTVLLAAARFCSPPLGILLALVGIALTFWGTDRPLLRFTSGLAAFAVGWFGAASILSGGQLPLGPEVLPLASAIALGVLGLVWPVAAAFVIAAVLGARLVSGWIPLSDALVRGLIAGTLTGVVGAFFFRGVLAIATATVGAVFLTVGIWSVALKTGFGGFLGNWPVLPLLPAALLAIAGAALQLTRKGGAPAHGREVAS